jgi:hypothetical protein
MRRQPAAAPARSARPVSRITASIAVAAVFLVLVGCARHQPVLYPNAKVQAVGPAQVDADVNDCMQLADSYVGNTNRAAETAKSTGFGAAIGSAIGAAVGAIRGFAGRGAAVGAAGGGAGGLVRGVSRSRTNDPVFQRFVDR